MSRSSRPRSVRLFVGAVVVLLALAIAAPPAATAARQQVARDPVIFDGEHGLEDVDARRGAVDPTAEQLAMARALGATRVSWNRFGTPQSMIRPGGYLATGLPGRPAASSPKRWRSRTA